VSSTYTERISFIQKNFGKGVLSRDGNDITIGCPNCKSLGKKKLAINLETWKYHCWVCSAKGNTIVSLLRKFKSREDADYFRSHFLHDKILGADSIIVDEKLELPDGFVPLPTLTRVTNPDYKSVIRYLSKRGITEYDCWRFRIGVANESRFSRRAIFISLDSSGDLNYYLGRSADSNARIRYVNASTDKTGIIFNDIDIDWDKPLYLVEGVFDLMALKENGSCLLGSSISENSLLFKKIVANDADVILCLDQDMTQKTGRIADLLTNYGCNVSIMDTSCAKDIAEMTPDQLIHAKETVRQWDMTASFKYKIANIKSGSLI